MLDSKLLNRVQELTPVRIKRGLDTPWGRDDDAWFRSQQRRFRVRAPIPGEYPSSKPADYVAIEETVPGLRWRVQLRFADGAPAFVAAMTRLIAHAAHRDDAARAAFAIASLCPGQCITLAELTELTASYETAPPNGDAMN
jgi:hypothetical protein